MNKHFEVKKMKHKKRLQKLQNFREKAIRRNANQKATLTTLHISLLVLRDKYGFGSKRLGDFVEHFADVLDSINLDYLDFEDIKNAIYEETGVKIL